ncbi:MAG: DsbA family protein, partial [Steroidobacteraceae bacterium]
GVAFAGAPPYPVDPDELANRVATLAALEGWCPEFTRAAYDAWFVGKNDPGNPDVLHALLASLGQDAERCLARADDADVRAAYDARTTQARELGLFGSPSFVCGSEVFWGDDRLEEAIDWALAHR